MSDKIKAKVSDNQKTYQLSDVELSFINALDTVQRSFDFYLNALKEEYLKQVTLRFGYQLEDKLSADVDMEKKSITISKQS